MQGALDASDTFIRRSYPDVEQSSRPRLACVRDPRLRRERKQIRGRPRYDAQVEIAPEAWQPSSVILPEEPRASHRA